MSESTHAVFISYAREDTAAAQRIAEALRSHGVEVWFDQNELRGGDTWDQKIRRQINDCTLFLPIISAHTQARSKGYFRLEWKLAVEQTHLMLEGVPFLAPIVIDGTTESGAAVPAEFMRVQWTRLPGALPSPQFIEQVKRLLAPASEVARVSRPVGSENTGRETRATPKRAVPLRLLAAVAVIAIGLTATFFATRKSPSAAAKPPTDLAAKSAAKSIAVLPFVNLGADKADEYLSDGMTEELLNVLAQVKGLRVPGRSSSFAFKGRTEEGIFRKVGEQLHVSTVLEGSVRKAGKTLRITAQLINVADGYNLWSQTYDKEMTDILAIQSDVAQQVVQALKIQLGVEDARALAKKATVNTEAHRLYLLGRFHFTKTTQAGWADAIQAFTQAIQLDPGYALAYCGLADNYGLRGGSLMLGKEAWAKQKEAAQKALALDPELAEAHLSLGLALAGDYDWPGVDRELNRALELNPNLALAHVQYGWMLNVLGRFDESVAQSRRAVELDPLSPLMNGDLGWRFYNARRFDEAIAQARKTLILDPNYANGHHLLGWSLHWKGDAVAAVAALQKGQSLDPNPWDIGALGHALAVSGDRTKAEQTLRDLEILAKQRYVTPAASMTIYLGLGEKEKALEWLEKCYADRDPQCWFLKVDPLVDSMRNEPRFQALLKKVGLEK